MCFVGVVLVSLDCVIVKCGGGLMGLVVMLGVLVFGLVVIWVFVVFESGLV